jgi:hypothetical protein
MVKYLWDGTRLSLYLKDLLNEKQKLVWLAGAVVDVTTADTTGGSDRVDCGAGDEAICVTRLQDAKGLPRFSPPIG